MRYRAGSTVQVHSDPKDRTIAAVGSGEGRMIHVGQRKFTEAEELVRATGPFHIEIVAEVEPQVDLPALQLVNDGAVVNAMNGHARVKQTVSLPAVWAVIPEGRA